MNLEDMKLSEISQSQKDKYCTIPLDYQVSRAVKSIDTEGRMRVGCQDLGVGEQTMMSCYLMDTEFQFCKTKRVVEIEFTTMNNLILLNCTLKNG